MHDKYIGNYVEAWRDQCILCVVVAHREDVFEQTKDRRCSVVQEIPQIPERSQYTQRILGI
jgi:hypothetical protein